MSEMADMVKIIEQRLHLMISKYEERNQKDKAVALMLVLKDMTDFTVGAVCHFMNTMEKVQNVKKSIDPPNPSDKRVLLRDASTQSLSNTSVLPLQDSKADSLDNTDGSSSNGLLHTSTEMSQSTKEDCGEMIKVPLPTENMDKKVSSTEKLNNTSVSSLNSSTSLLNCTGISVDSISNLSDILSPISATALASTPISGMEVTSRVAPVAISPANSLSDLSTASLPTSALSSVSVCDMELAVGDIPLPTTAADNMPNFYAEALPNSNLSESTSSSVVGNASSYAHLSTSLVDMLPDLSTHNVGLEAEVMLNESDDFEIIFEGELIRNPPVDKENNAVKGEDEDEVMVIDNVSDDAKHEVKKDNFDENGSVKSFNDGSEGVKAYRLPCKVSQGTDVVNLTMKQPNDNVILLTTDVKGKNEKAAANLLRMNGSSLGMLRTRILDINFPSYVSNLIITSNDEWLKETPKELTRLFEAIKSRIPNVKIFFVPYAEGQNLYKMIHLAKNAASSMPGINIIHPNQFYQDYVALFHSKHHSKDVKVFFRNLNDFVIRCRKHPEAVQLL